MRILIAAAGKSKSCAEQTLYTEFARRLPWKLTLVEVELKKKLSDPAARRKAEAEQLLDACRGMDIIVALDERGSMLSSREFSQQLAAWGGRGDSRIAFVIGGADGHGEALLKRANLTVSFGRMTWPHLLVRALLAEQLYRAHTLLAGHPYHRE